MKTGEPTTGLKEMDRLIGGLLAGDNLVWEVDSGAPAEGFVSDFVSAYEQRELPVVYVSFNRSPQTMAETFGGLMSAGRFILVDCFSSGKGNSDDMFLKFFEGTETPGRALRIENPTDPAKLQAELARISSDEEPNARYVFDSLTGMFDLWGDEEVVLRFFGHLCPRLYDLNTIAYWLLEKEAHSERFLAKLRHITQVVIEVAMSEGVSTLSVRKAAKRRCTAIGVPQRFALQDGRFVMAIESREDQELGLLTRMGEAMETALEPDSFFEQTMRVLAKDLGMIRGTLVLLDRTTNKLKIAAAHGLSPDEREKGEYAIGEGVTGHVVRTGLPEVVPDISKDARFLDRTTSRRADRARPIAFICVPVKEDAETVGALSIDRPSATDASLDKDLRLLRIVTSIVSQVLKINRIVSVEKEQVLARDEQILRELRGRYRLDNVVGQSETIQKVLATAATVAKSRTSILITGETGTGKELVANVIHYNSTRADGPFIKVHCGALTETLLESELFGHVKGAFTGAVESRKGRFELAHGGTLFLDEVAEMSPRLQVKLLRVLQEKEFEPVGGTKALRVDVRVVAATNKDPAAAVQEGRMREDLYYRLNVIPIHLPPLRERRGDIPLLVDHFLDIYNKQNAKNVTKISRKVLDRLLEYSWPGNVRELENCIERAVVLSPGDALALSLLPETVVSRKGAIASRLSTDIPGCAEQIRQAAQRWCEGTHDLAEAREKLLRVVEETVIQQALLQKMTQRELAAKLGMSRMTLRKRIQEYGLR